MSSSASSPPLVEPKKISTLKLVMNSLVASSVSNVAGIIAGHPLDTIKVRMQLDSRKITARQCAQEAIMKEGPMSLMKGLS